MNKIIGMLSIVTTLAISAVSFAGATGGPKFVNDTVVLGNSTDYYTVYFRGNEFARVVMKGEGSSDLDCYLYDQNGNLVAQDLNSEDFCELKFAPRWTGPFVIYVRNLGDNPNMYSMRTN